MNLLEAIEAMHEAHGKAQAQRRRDARTAAWIMICIVVLIALIALWIN